jgi:oxygen-independent coproporphyrinogen III oxidase
MILPTTTDWRVAIARPRHLYIHIPFCHRRCSYCDFNTYANMEDRMEAYVAALCAELALCAQMPLAAEPLALAGPGLSAADLQPTIFLGGGTPTMLPIHLMERVLAAADQVIPLATAEVTSEANPGTVLGRDYLRQLRALGVNRLSMGVQSLHDPTLRILGRIHTAEEARRSFLDARNAGFDRINLDFMFGLPGQSEQQWAESLAEIITWGVDHFSLYSLILEESTPLYAQVTSGRMQIPDDDSTGAMYECAIDLLGTAGYQHYEISNWATAGQACQHNIAYWLNVDYLGCGAGAHGHLYPRRYADVLAIDAYIQQVQQGIAIHEITELTARDLAAETMFMGLRMTQGVAEKHFQARCGASFDTFFGQELAELLEQELIIRDTTGIRLSARGRMLGNRVFERFV